MFHFKAGTFMSRRGEGEVEVSMGLRNAFGYADQFEIEAVRGASLSSTYSALWRQPKLYGSDAEFGRRAFQALECFKKLSSFDVTSRGISVDLTGDGPGTLDYTIAWRDVQDPTRAASRGVRRQLGHRSNRRWRTLRSDHLDRPVRPMTGYLWKVRSELAGIGLMNDPMATKFVKSEITTQRVETLDADRGVTASLSGRLGVLIPWGSSDKEGELQTCIADRFFLGGVGCLRQFENNGVGPSDSRRSTSKSEKAASADEEPLSRETPSVAISCGAQPRRSKWTYRAKSLRPCARLASTSTRSRTWARSAHRRRAERAEGLGQGDARLGASVSGCRRGLAATDRSRLKLITARWCARGAHDRVKDGFQVGIASHPSMYGKSVVNNKFDESKITTSVRVTPIPRGTPPATANSSVSSCADSSMSFRERSSMFKP